MMKSITSARYLCLVVAAIFLTNCSGPKSTQQITQNDDLIEFVFIQANDVYEISPLQGGKVGGLARVATVRKELLKENKNTLTVHAGDFLNPSLIGTVKLHGEKIKGKQMIQVMNSVGFDLVTYGNHEFDLDEDELQARMNESNFEWTSCNTFQKCGEETYPFYRMVNGRKHFSPETYTWEIKDADGTSIKVGIFGVCLPVNQKDYVHYDEIFESSRKAVADLSKTADVVIGLTHLDIKQDIKLARMVSAEVPLIMGGHDHDNMCEQIGQTKIAKADANVKTVYIHRLTYNKKTDECTVKSELKEINDSILDDPETIAVVNKWSDILLTKVSEIVDEPNSVIYTAEVPLDGRESSIRHKQTNLGGLLVKAFCKYADGVDGAIINSGSFRIDDQIFGSVTPIDFFRALPYGGSIIEVELTGALLKKILDEGEAAKGDGGYLQRHKLELKDDQWIVSGKVLEESKTYTIAMNDFLLAGYDLKFFTRKNPGILSIKEPDPEDKTDVTRDVRLAVIQMLKEK